MLKYEATPEAYEEKTKRVQKVHCLEIWCTILLAVLVYFISISSLWDRVYIDTVVNDWKKAPLMDLKVVGSSQSCPSDYETMGKAYWWGVERGCTCKNSQYAQVKKEVCTDKMRKDYCLDTPKRDPKWLEVIHGKKICGKRNKASLIKMTKPKHYEKNAKGVTIECKSGYDLCGKPTTAVDFEQVWCVPSNEACPLTSVDFDNDMNPTMSTDAAKGEPVVDIQLSQGGPPCIHYASYHNVQLEPKKKSFALLPKDYFKGCKTIEIDGKKLTSSNLFQQMTGFSGVTELDLLEDNLKKVDLKYIKQWAGAGYNYKDYMGKYTYHMYQKKYLKWSDKCVYSTAASAKGKSDNQITPKDLVTAVEYADSIVFWVEFLWGLIQANVYLQLLEFFCIFTHRQGVVWKSWYDRFGILRRSISLITYILALVSFIMIYKWDGHTLIEALSQTKTCTSDPVLGATFDDIKTYMHKTQSVAAKVFLLGNFIVVFGSFLASSYLVFVDCRQCYNKVDWEAVDQKDDDNYKLQQNESD